MISNTCISRSSRNIKRKDLHSKSWEDIINTISEKNESIPIDEITSIILKRENYFIAFITNNIFKIPQDLFTKQLEINLYYGLNPFEFSNKTKHDIQKRLFLLGIINLILSPFILTYVIASFIFYNIDELYLNKKNILDIKHNYIIYKPIICTNKLDSSI